LTVTDGAPLDDPDLLFGEAVEPIHDIVYEPVRVPDALIDGTNTNSINLALYLTPNSTLKAPCCVILSITQHSE